MRKTVRLFDLGQSTTCESSPRQLIYRQNSTEPHPTTHCLATRSVTLTATTSPAPMASAAAFDPDATAKVSLKYRARNGTTAHLYERDRHSQKTAQH